MLKAAVPSLTRNLLVLDSREAILSLAPLLQDLASRCGQPGAMHWLPYFVDKAVAGRRAPRLVLMLRPEEDEARGLGAKDVEAAALFFEYEICGLGTGVVATADAVGFNSVIAPAGQRAAVAAAAARALVDRGAAVVFATYESGTEPEPSAAVAGWPEVKWAAQQRLVPRMLRLLPTLDATLAQMGKSTRFNLRYYRRRLEKEMDCEFVADAAPLLRDADLEGINQHSLNPVPAAEFARRVTCASLLPGSFLCGLRGSDGQWLSLVGGWRQDGTTTLYWQTNTAGLEKHSIGTVMRSFFLEHEIACGAENLLIFGGTPHTMRHAFGEDLIADLVIERPGLRALAIRAAARCLSSPRLFNRANFVATTLCRGDLQWQCAPKKLPTAPSAALEPMRAQHAA